jgi:hypothetical protein
VDANGDGFVETLATSVTTPSNNGDRETLVDINNGDGSNRGQTLTRVSGNGLQNTVSQDFDGDRLYDNAERMSIAA